MKRLSNRSGFSLLELMIVVAIIALLAAVAIPSYRRMVQQARQAEAKQQLASLYASEMMTQSAYQTYANDLFKFGFAVDGGPANSTYSVGFPTNTQACGDNARFPNIPVAGSGDAGERIQRGIANYFAATTPARAVITVIRGNPDNLDCRNTASLTTTNNFIAFAAGRLHPNNVGNDVWSINEGRVLTNVRNGVE